MEGAVIRLEEMAVNDQSMFLNQFEIERDSEICGGGEVVGKCVSTAYCSVAGAGDFRDETCMICPEGPSCMALGELKSADHIPGAAVKFLLGALNANAAAASSASTTDGWVRSLSIYAPGWMASLGGRRNLSTAGRRLPW